MRLLPKIVFFFTVVFALVSCKKEDDTTPFFPPVNRAPEIDTFTTSGKEYIFDNRSWDEHYWDEYDLRWNAIEVVAPNRFIFSDPAKKVEVSVILEGTTWTTVPKHTSLLHQSFGYYFLGGKLIILPVYVYPNENLFGSRTAIKLRFL